LNITNSATKTDELCKITQAKCNETIASIELMVKNLGSQVDTKAIVRGIEETIKSTFLPLKIRADSLAHAIEPTLEKLNAASERAAQLWPQRIWKMALTAGVIVGLSIACSWPKVPNRSAPPTANNFMSRPTQVNCRKHRQV
jgi:hypothetical protein